LLRLSATSRSLCSSARVSALSAVSIRCCSTSSSLSAANAASASYHRPWHPARFEGVLFAALLAISIARPSLASVFCADEIGACTKRRVSKPPVLSCASTPACRLGSPQASQLPQPGVASAPASICPAASGVASAGHPSRAQSPFPPSGDAHRCCAALGPEGRRPRQAPPTGFPMRRAQRHPRGQSLCGRRAGADIGRHLPMPACGAPAAHAACCMLLLARVIGGCYQLNAAQWRGSGCRGHGDRRR